jgi:hypothetical protein
LKLVYSGNKTECNAWNRLKLSKAVNRTIACYMEFIFGQRNWHASSYRNTKEGTVRTTDNRIRQKLYN